MTLNVGCLEFIFTTEQKQDGHIVGPKSPKSCFIFNISFSDTQ